MRDRSTVAGVCVALVGGAAGCGSGTTELEDVSGGRPYAVTAEATFAARQGLARTRTLEVVVRNRDDRPIPDVTVELAGLQAAGSDRDNGSGPVSDPRRPVWIVDATPTGQVNAYDRTWSLGRLPPGASRAFRWRLTPAVAGRRRLTWTVSAGVDGRAPVRVAGRAKPRGTFSVRIANAHREAGR